MNTRLLSLLLCCISTIAQADLALSVKSATSVTTATTTEVMQVQTADGESIGAPTKVAKPSVIQAGKPVAILFVKTDRPINELLVKVKSKTCKPVLIETGVYSISEAGKHEIEVGAIGQNPLFWGEETITIEVGKSPPTPTPTPNPPGPGPLPPSTDAPIAGAGLRVLFVVESGVGLSKELQPIVYGATVRGFLNASCVKVDGQPDFRVVDPDAEFTDPNHRFAKALARPRASVPWLIISNGITGYEGPFPATETATLELVRSLMPLQSSNTSKLGTIVMYSNDSCAPCFSFKNKELPRLVGVEFIEKLPIPGVASTPTFDIYSNSKSQRVVGYQTAYTLMSILKGMNQ